MITPKAKDRVLQSDPIMRELVPVHRRLRAPGYVPDRIVVEEVEDHVVRYHSDADTDRLRARYLFESLGVEDVFPRGASWGRLFGNFMGTVAVFGTLLDVARTDHHGLVIDKDTTDIMRIVRSLKEYRGAFRAAANGECTNVFSAMRMSAAFCGRAIDDLVGLFFTPEHRVVVGADGHAVLNTSVGHDDIRAWLDGKREPSALIEGACILFTDGGLKAFKGWVAKTAHPMRFIDEGLPHDVILGAKEMYRMSSKAEVDPFGSVDKLPPPHPSYASPVNRVLVELVDIARNNGIPVLQARWNGWRRSVDVRVHTDHVDAFLELVRQSGEMRSLCGSHHWWMERLGRQASIVIPTQPSIHIERFENLTRPLWGKVREFDGHLREFDLNSRKKLRLDVDRLDELLELLNHLANMKDFLSKEMEKDPRARTQERYTLHEWIARLEHVMKPYRMLKRHLRQEGVMRYQMQQCLDSKTFNLFEHIPATAHRWTIPRTQIDLPNPRPELIPLRWIEAHKLITRLYLFATEVAGAFEDDSAYPAHVKAFITVDKPNSRIVMLNNDGRLVESLTHVDPEGEVDLMPRLVRELFDLSKIVAPPGERLTVDVEKKVIFIPIERATQGEPDMPGGSTDEGIKSRYPALFGQGSGGCQASLFMTAFPLSTGFALPVRG